MHLKIPPSGRRPSQCCNFSRYFCALSLIWGLYASDTGMKCNNPNNAAWLGINITQCDVSFAVKLLLWCKQLPSSINIGTERTLELRCPGCEKLCIFRHQDCCAEGYQYTSRNVNIFVGIMEAGLVKHEVFEDSIQHFLPSAFSERGGYLAHNRTLPGIGWSLYASVASLFPVILQTPQRRLC